MNWPIFWTVFATVFMAELGDKTQLATMVFAADGKNSPWVIFAGSACALVLASGLGVLAGAFITKFMDPKILGLLAGIAFIVIGAWQIRGFVKDKSEASKTEQVQ